MKGTTALGVVLGLLVGAFSVFMAMSAITADAGCTDDPCENPPCCNGDVNGDGTIGLADAVYILQYLFAQGPELAAVPCTERFVDNGDGTVTDTLTGLMWQQDTADIDGDGTISPEDEVTKSVASEYVSTLRLGAYDDWELPNTRELCSIVDFTRWDPCIDPVFNAEVSNYWISSTNGGDWCHGSNFVLHFGGGFIEVWGEGVKSLYPAYVRAVRTTR